MTLSARLKAGLQRNWTRREVLKLTAASATAVGLGALGYGFAVRDHVEVSRVAVKIANLPAAFDGLTIAQLSDIHHGPYTGLDYIRRCVEITNGLQPDVIALTGDFTFAGKKHVAPCAEALSGLKARVGVYAVLGNHDYYVGAGHVARALKEAGCNVLIDALDRLEYRGDKLWLVGVDDLYYGTTNLKQLLRDVPRQAARITLSHNPDFIEEFAARNQHTDLLIAGHTHGGQIRFPLVGAPHISSDYGQQYAVGMNRKDAMQVYTTRGIGTILLPTRVDCPPEIVLFTLRQA
ncbi:MAG TPA: metallophosphoesterase [Blastocatellia bacterium]|nr:metallophosphoesterase [Blastocatellia bacterium]HMZ22104.1 metallophosphoesterase [Blastocatellia bacterium]HNG32486.1 metallophosphoesterase [Blastocatellia bacterium]